jgi:hypothetical protein
MAAMAAMPPPTIVFMWIPSFCAFWMGGLVLRLVETGVLGLRQT